MLESISDYDVIVHNWVVGTFLGVVECACGLCFFFKVLLLCFCGMYALLGYGVLPRTRDPTTRACKRSCWVCLRVRVHVCVCTCACARVRVRVRVRVCTCARVFSERASIKKYA